MAPSEKEGYSGVPIIVDLAFASNVRFLDDHELHLDNVELYKVRIRRVANVPQDKMEIPVSI